MAQKRIILLLDGTWNDRDSGPIDTSVVRMQEIIARSLNPGPASVQDSPTVGQASSAQKLVAGRTFKTEKVEHLVFYERGVGTGPFDYIGGGAFGEGVSDNIRRAYKFLSFYYQDGDPIFVFGFSRGAYTARSLVGYIAAAGLLKRDHCTPEWEGKAWSFYRTAPDDRFPGLWKQLQPHMNDPAKFKVDCLGVFDTVGALGIPLREFWRENRERYQFHNVDLSTITRVNLHAIAIDEHRYPFAATIWRKPKFQGFDTHTEQVWFPGAHSDVGGGYVPEELRQSKYKYALDDVALDWMLKRLKFYFGDGFPAIWPGPPLDSSWAKAPQHEPRRRYFKFWRVALRAIANYEIAVNRWRLEDIVCRDRHAEVIGEMVHISALQRLGQNISIEGRASRYAPKNLVTVLDRIEATYTGNAPEASTEIKVVNWNGRWFDPRDAADQSAVLGIVKAAQDSLSTSRWWWRRSKSPSGDRDGSSSGRNGRLLNL